MELFKGNERIHLKSEIDRELVETLFSHTPEELRVLHDGAKIGSLREILILERWKDVSEREILNSRNLSDFESAREKAPKELKPMMDKKRRNLASEIIDTSISKGDILQVFESSDDEEIREKCKERLNYLSLKDLEEALKESDPKEKLEKIKDVVKMSFPEADAEIKGIGIWDSLLKKGLDEAMGEGNMSEKVRMLIDIIKNSPAVEKLKGEGGVEKRGSIIIEQRRPAKEIKREENFLTYAEKLYKVTRKFPLDMIVTKEALDEIVRIHKMSENSVKDLEAKAHDLTHNSPEEQDLLQKIKAIKEIVSLMDSDFIN